MDNEATVRPEKGSVAEKITEIFGLDVRTLALFRVALGIFLIGELLARLTDLTAFYTDAGVIPRYLLPPDIPLSIHTADGSRWYQLIVFGIAGIFAVMLLVGWKTRLATVMSWFLIISVQARNPAIQHNGDVVIRMILFWAMFLPLGACYSIDSRYSPRPEGTSPMVISAGTIAYILQLVIIYWFAVVWKYAPQWRIDHTAVSYAVHVEPLASRLGVWLRQFPEVMKFLTVTTLIVEGAGPALMLFPFFTQSLRILTVLLFIGLHTGFGLFIVLGNFAPVCYVAWLAVLPPLFWTLLQKWFYNPARSESTLYFDADNPRSRGRVGLLWSILLFYQARCVAFQDAPEGQERRQEGDEWLVVDREGNEHRGYEAILFIVGLSPVYWPLAWVLRRPHVRAWGERRYQRRSAKPVRPLETQPPTWNQLAWAHASSAVATLVVFSFLIYVFLWNVRTVSHRLPEKVQKRLGQIFPRQFDSLGTALGLSQGWGVFAPAPGTRHGWFVIYATLANGERVCLEFDGHELHATPVENNEEELEAKPKYVSETYINSRWRRYLQNIPDPGYASIRPSFAMYLVRIWDDAHSENRIATLEIYLMEQHTLPDGFTEPRKRLVYRHAVLPHHLSHNPE